MRRLYLFLLLFLVACGGSLETPPSPCALDSGALNIPDAAPDMPDAPDTLDACMLVTVCTDGGDSCVVMCQ